MNLLLVVLDGIGDWPCVELQGKTPLQAAHKPNIDKLGLNSILRSGRIARSIAPQSDVGILSILGINPFQKQIGRGIFEWMSTDKKFRTGWLAMRSNFCTLNKKNNLVDRRVGRNLLRNEAKQLEKEINKIRLSVPFEFIATSGHRGVVVFKGNFSKYIQNTDPAYQKTKSGLSNAIARFKNKIIPAEPLEKGKKSTRTAQIVNEFTWKVIEQLKNSSINVKRQKKRMLEANGVLLRDGETQIPFSDYSKWTIVAEMPLEIGIGKAFQMNVVTCKEGSYKKEAIIASREVKKRNVYVHLKGPDLYGHDGEVEKKKKCIEKIDSQFFSNLNIDLKKTRVVIAADHATPCPLKAHSSDSVPILISGAGVTGKKNVFDEKHAWKQREIPAWKMLSLAKKPILKV